MMRTSRAERLARLKEQLSQSYLARDQQSAHDVAPLRNHLQQIDWLLIAVLGERIRCQAQLDALTKPQLGAASLTARMNNVLANAEKLALQLDVDTHLVEQVIRIIESWAINQSLTRHFKVSNTRTRKAPRKEPVEPAPTNPPEVTDSPQEGGVSAP